MSYRSNDNKKLSKDEMEQKLLEMEQRAEFLQRQRDEKYKIDQQTDKDHIQTEIKDGMKPKFVNNIEKEAFVEHNMDLAESINRKKHYNERIGDN